MKKSLFALAPVGLLLLVLITITGSVVATSCDINLSTTSLDLGNVAQTAFTTALEPVTASKREFALTLSNCGTPEASQVAQVQVSGRAEQYLQQRFST
ncbi:MAG: fimbrial protein [Symbiopectobacterium sp.]|uniref:fimbrial protein n=1 Tax=Symbiopectobacterium sp. TaxID=2952789 RepID=UPI0039EC27F2